MKKVCSILVVDDNPGDHIIAKFAIEEFDQNIEILSAYDGEQALDILGKADKTPEIILLDINMPGMNGLEFLQEYAKNPKTSSVVAILTSSNQYSDRETCLSYNFVINYLVKPLEKKYIENIVEQIM